MHLHTIITTNPGPMDPPPPDSANSSPRSRPNNTAWDDTSVPQIPGAKLRLMCSYGGHIIPRPHDKSLCYVGGDTRIVVVDRHSPLPDLHARLSHALLNGRHLALKYQLPTEDLDSLISIATDEDLENMIEEYDRSTSASPLKPSRIRLFLFPTKPETASSMGCLLDDAKSETWFVDALNGSGLLPRGLSESAAIDTIIELNHSDSVTDLEAQKQAPAKGNAQEVVVAVETSSSFGSSSSSPSMANLPQIKVRAEDYMMVGLDEQFSNVSVANAAARSGGENREDERSDQGMVRLRKPPLPLQPVQRKVVDVHNLASPDSKHAGGYNLPSPDSVASDCSITSAGSASKHLLVHQDTMTRVAPSPPPQPDPKHINNNNIQDPNTQDPIPIPQQQQFIPNNTHYIQHQHQHPQVTMSSYYPMYLHPQTHQTDPQYQMYMLPPQPQPPYDPSATRPPLPPTKPEMAANMHHQMGGGPMLVQVPAHQYQQHYIIPQSNAANGGVSYGYEYSHQIQDQDNYYAQPPPSAYQTMTPATAVMFTQASAQVPPDNNAQQS